MPARSIFKHSAYIKKYLYSFIVRRSIVLTFRVMSILTSLLELDLVKREDYINLVSSSTAIDSVV